MNILKLSVISQATSDNSGILEYQNWYLCQVPKETMLLFAQEIILL